MLARELMTKDVISVSPDTPVTEISRLLAAKGISAVPVIDGAGKAVGMVSEGDLIGRTNEEREARQEWWLTLFAEGEDLNPEFLKTIRKPQLKARDVMHAPVIRVTEGTPAKEIARILRDNRIKRVPVERDGRIVGIVSRANLLEALVQS